MFPILSIAFVVVEQTTTARNVIMLGIDHELFFQGVAVLLLDSKKVVAS